MLSLKGNKSEESDEEFFLRDGTPVPNAILHSLTTCRAIKSSKVSAVAKIFLHFREECAEEVHKMKLGSKLKESAVGHVIAHDCLIIWSQ